ncbi:tetratricopeptide repeat protein [Streptomyces sp. NBC_01707]|uniref:tetratricopeptide repeat protein n=1 Tax=unclassified Streptomyces TaxID=2593676 RepID=UPI002E137678|nr:tetratricopeptide repeat protein [Streptomyces sp. NBC_01230]
MKGKRLRDKQDDTPAAPEVSASQGANAAGRDLVNSVAVYAENALPAEAYGPIPDDAAKSPVLNIPRTDLFIGRTSHLDLLDEAFTNPGGVVLRAVSGLGGVGKSTLAAHWAAHRATAPVRWWITADSPAAIDASLAELARALQPGLASLPTELQKERAVAWLAGHDDWLLILDNVDAPADVQPLLNRLTTRGRVLITTRMATGWHLHTATIRLDVFTPTEAVDLFTRILTHDGPRDTEGTPDLCADLGHLAIAVEQAAAYCHETGTTPQRYLDMLRQWPAEMLAESAAGTDAERTVARIWHLTLHRLTTTPIAEQILRLLAWYAPDHIPRTLLDGLAPPPALTTAIGRLIAYSMITDNPDGTLSVHRLVQALARTPQTDTTTTAREQATRQLLTVFPDETGVPTNWPRCRELLPHVGALASSSAPQLDTTDTTRLLFLAGDYQREQGAFAPAIAYLARAHAGNAQVLGRDHPDTLKSQSARATTFLRAGDLERATLLHERTLADRERVLGDDHPDTLASRNGLAIAYADSGHLDRAIQLHERTLADRERVLGGDHPDTLSSRNNLAIACYEAEDLERAIPLFERTLAHRERVLGADHPDTLQSRFNLANAYSRAGDRERAIPLFERAVADRERVLGDDHPNTLDARHGLAIAYEAAGDRERAMPLFERAVADYERVLGGDHRATLDARYDLADAYSGAGDRERAIPLFERAVADRERVLGDDHPNTLDARHGLAIAYEAAGDRERAMPLFERAVADYERVLGGDHRATLDARFNLANAYSRAGDPARAILLHERTLASYQRIRGDGHPDTLVSRNALAIAYFEADDLKRAITLLERTLADRERVFGGDHPDTLSSRNNLAYAYMKSGDPGRAILMWEEVLVVCDRVLGSSHQLSALVRENLDSARG